nr:hypothetical protein [Microbispora rosea]
MRRLIASRPVRLALAVALVVGVAAGIAAARRRRAAVPVPARPRPARRRESAPEPPGQGPGPVLGHPTREDLKRYDRPEGGAPVARLLDGLRRGDRSRVTVARRWIVAAVALGLLALGAQVLDNAVFAPEREASYGGTAHAGAEARPCPAHGCETAGSGLSAGRASRSCPASGCGAAGEPAPTAGPAGANPVNTDPAPREPAPFPAPACAVRSTHAVPVVRPISRRVTAAVNRQWRRIERWLRAHAPKTYASLNGPAGARLVAKAEARLGRRIPDSLRASLLRHNGAGGSAAFRFSPHYQIMGARGVVASWPEACVMGGGIPFAYNSDGADYLVTNPATGGVGSADWETPYFEDEWSSYYALLKTTADALAEGGPVGGFVPVVREGALEWE